MQDQNRVVYQAGERIFSEGEPGNCAYIIDRGGVIISARVAGGPDVALGELGQGELFGEMALIDSPLRSASATAREETELVVIPRAHFEARIDVADKLVQLFMKVLLSRYREIRDRYQAVLAGNPPAPVARRATYTEDTARAKHRVEAEAALKSALERGQLALFYQPIVALGERRLAGCESLIRWRHPERGLVPPGEFIGLAEESGLIVPIGLWILEEACQAWRRFSIRSKSPLYVSINLSGRQFESTDLVGDIRAIFGATGADPDLIKLEVTESLLMSNPLQVAEMLFGLKSLGTHIALDDFGTGYSSFSYLHRFPIDTLKIDRAFVSTMTDNAKSREIVRTLCALAHSIGMSVIAEGVETEEELNLLTQFGADYGQGYYFSKPLAENDFMAFIEGF